MIAMSAVFISFPGCEWARHNQVRERFASSRRQVRERCASLRREARPLARDLSLRDEGAMLTRSNGPRRSALYVPATNGKALVKLSSLKADVVIVDLEDSVAPERKDEARETVRRVVRERPGSAREWVVRINALGSPGGTDDLMAAVAARPDAILLPKVEGPRDIVEADDALDEMDAPKTLQIWAMIETPRAVLNLGAIAELGRDPAARLGGFVAGLNDLAKLTGARLTRDRRNLVPHLAQIVLAARAAGITALDSASNDFRDLDAFAVECRQGADLGFNGKTLIHPAQIAACETAFSPDATEIDRALAIRAAFARPDAEGRGAIQLDGEMVERLHLEQAEALLKRAGISGDPS
jgi:citrate lyase subunit beta / citryl-CoA lyase